VVAHRTEVLLEVIDLCGGLIFEGAPIQIFGASWRDKRRDFFHAD